MPFRNLSAHAKGATSSHNDFSGQGMVRPGSSEEPPSTWEQSHTITKPWTSCTCIPVAPGDPTGPRMKELLSVWLCFISPGMCLIWVKLNYTHIMCSTFMLQSKQFFQDQITFIERSTSYKPWTWFGQFFQDLKTFISKLISFWWDTFIQKACKMFSCCKPFQRWL